MNKQHVVELVLQTRLVAIIRLEDLSTAHDLVSAMVAGGIRVIEFTLTNSQAPKLVSQLVTQVPAFTDGTASIGLGSVRNLDEAKLAVDSGAQFLVSPVCFAEIIDQALKMNVACMPGAYTPTEIARAHDCGADVIKVFPAGGLGPSYIRDVLAPMPYLKLMPTGGVQVAGMAEYFKVGAVAVGMGGQLFSPSALAQQDWRAIEHASKIASSMAAR